MLGDGEKLCIRMVPGVPAFIVWRRRQQTVRSVFTPVRLPLATDSVTSCAMLCIDASAGLHRLWVIGTKRIGFWRGSPCTFRAQRISTCRSQEHG